MKPAIPRKIALIFLGIAFSFLLLELGLRLGGLIFASVQEYRNRVSAFKKGSYRIMCLGESTTAHQYPPFLEETLNQRHPGVKFSVIDKGVPGITTVAIISHLRDNLNTYKPDMVIAMMGNNDRRITYYKGIPEADTGIFRHCRVYRFIRLISVHIANKLKGKDIYGLNRATIAEEDSSPSEESLNGAMARHPEGNEGNIKLGKYYLQQGRLPEAEESFKKAIALNPKNDRAYLELGRYFQQQGRLAEAEKSFKKIIAFSPKNEWAYIELGTLYLWYARLPEAEESFKKAIALNPKNEWAYIQLGKISRYHSRLAAAEESFKKAIALNPKNDWAHIKLGELYLWYGRLPEAVESFRKILELNPRDEWKIDVANRALESLYGQMNKPELAKEYAKKAVNEYSSVTIDNYHRLKEILDKRGIRLVCVQYPMRSVEPLKEIFEGEPGVLFVDNERAFKEAVAQGGYKEYFDDMFGGDFGHCSRNGNRLLAKNIADVILKEVFGK